jgi:hypothetical protein
VRSPVHGLVLPRPQARPWARRPRVSVAVLVLLVRPDPYCVLHQRAGLLLVSSIWYGASFPISLPLPFVLSFFLSHLLSLSNQVHG